MARKIQMTRFTLMNLIFFSILGGTFLSPLVYSGLRESLHRQGVEGDPLSEADQLTAIALQKNFINVFKKAQPSVVYIKTNIVVQPHAWFDYYQQLEGQGTGVIIDQEGYIVTNSHVVANAQSIEVTFSDSTKAEAKLVGRDENSDVAVIKVPASARLQPALLGDSDKVEPGQLAFALGSPFGLESTFTQGIISAKSRNIDDSKYTRIQTDASINPGNSGGPLLNIYGQVIGINQSIISPDGKGGSVGIGFAIPINEVKDTIDRLKKEKRVIGRAALGVSVGAASDNLREYLGIKEQLPGVVVRMVVPGSAAEKAGLKENDYIYQMNGMKVESPEDLIRAVQKAGVGATVKIDIYRGGKKLSLNGVIGEDLAD
jgi:serine protease Do